MVLEEDDLLGAMHRGKGASDAVLFIHGAYLSSACWNDWRRSYEVQGYPCEAPGWPYYDESVWDIRRRPAKGIDQLSISCIVNYYERIIRQFRTPPILIGHSFGGLFVQILLGRGLGKAGIAISPIPVRDAGSLRANMLALVGVRGWNRAFQMSFQMFSSSLAQTLSPTEQHALYEEYVVPTPARIHYEAVLGIGTKIRFRNSNRAPLLLVAGEKDMIVPPSVVRALRNRYGTSVHTTDLMVFPDRPHLMILSRGWQEIAAACLEWIKERS
jgi:pimeloyl-ACP methyl ester carboxylesterase